MYISLALTDPSGTFHIWINITTLKPSITHYLSELAAQWQLFTLCIFNTYLNNAFFVSVTHLHGISLFFPPNSFTCLAAFSPPSLNNKSLAGVVMDFAASQRKQYLWARGGLCWWRGGWGGWELALLVLCAFCSQTRH